MELFSVYYFLPGSPGEWRLWAANLDLWGAREAAAALRLEHGHGNIDLVSQIDGHISPEYCTYPFPS